MKSKQRFRLLPYQNFAKRWRSPALWLIPGGLALWWSLPRINPNLQYGYLGLGVSVAGFLIVIYTLLAGQAHVSCHASHFVVHTPLYPVAFSYRRVEMTRPTEFRSIRDPAEEKNARRRLYQNLWGKTAVMVDLKSYPLPLWWIRMWFHPYLLHPKEKALVLLVEDWMGLSRSLESLRSTWREKRRR